MRGRFSNEIVKIEDESPSIFQEVDKFGILNFCLQDDFRKAADKLI